MNDKITNSLDTKKLTYEPLTLHKRKIAGKSVHLISRSAYRKLTRSRFATKLSNWSHAIHRNITRLAHRRSVR